MLRPVLGEDDVLDAVGVELAVTALVEHGFGVEAVDLAVAEERAVRVAVSHVARAGGIVDAATPFTSMTRPNPCRFAYSTLWKRSSESLTSASCRGWADAEPTVPSTMPKARPMPMSGLRMDRM